MKCVLIKQVCIQSLVGSSVLESGHFFDTVCPKSFKCLRVEAELNSTQKLQPFPNAIHLINIFGTHRSCEVEQRCHFVNACHL